VFPVALVQISVVPLLRHGVDFLSGKDRKLVVGL
jgi:hypothetical protein